MKLILALLLSGVACTIAISPVCFKSPYEQCNWLRDPRFEEDGYLETEDFVDEICDQQGCMMLYEEICGTSVFSNLDTAFKQSRKIYNSVCIKSIRQKYFENAKCVIQQGKIVASACNFPDERQHSDICPKMKAFLDCGRKLFLDCGEDAGDVFDALAPELSFYGC